MSELVDGQYRDTGWFSASAMLRIDHINRGVLYERAVGLARADTGAEITTDHQFLISSASKMMLAAVVLQLWEEGKLGESGLDATLAELGVFSEEVLRVISVVDGISYGPAITIRQLLTHTSGLGGNWRGLGFWERGDESIAAAMMQHFQCTQDPECDLAALPTSKQWRPYLREDPFAEEEALFNSYLSAERTRSSAIAKPGKEYHYRDLNFWIVGIVVEELEDKPLHDVLRERLYDPLGMDMTFQSFSGDTEEEAKNLSVADFFFGPMPVISTRVNFSIDWAAGGIATTLDDFSTFHLALIRGEMFDRAETYEAMRKTYWGPVDNEIMIEHVGLGYFSTRIGDNHFYGHTGFLGAFSFYDPKRSLVYTGTLNKMADETFYRIIADIGQSTELESAPSH